MLVVYLPTLPIFLIFGYTSAHITIDSENNQNLVECVTEIIKKYYKIPRITYMDINYDGNEIINVLHSIPKTVIARNAERNSRSTNYQYIIAVDTPYDFKNHFPLLIKDCFWNPYALFTIIIKSLDKKELRGIFDILMNFHVNDVIVLNGTGEAHLYTYNPFDNFNCGKRYDDVIEFGKCLKPKVDNVFPLKLVTGLRNCTFNATISHWPPYAMDPKKSNDIAIGAEQYAIQIISEKEHFKLNYTKSVSGDAFSTIADNMTVSGDLFMLQEKQTDIMFGGLFLIHFRACAFNFLCGHLPFMDDVRTFVHKAGWVPAWKNLFLEFHMTVWFTLIACFLVYFALVAAILGVKDKTSLLLIMIGLFFLHGSRRIFKAKGIFIIWVFFAYLINTYYQSSLVSFMAHPIKSYQISTVDDLDKYGMEPCIGVSIRKYISEMQSEPMELTSRDGCKTVLGSLESVSKSDKLYTVSLQSIYLYNKHMFYEEQEEEPIYPFKRPINGIIYAYYLYKGFPLQDKLELYTIRLRENGLINKHLNDLYAERAKRITKAETKTKAKKSCVTFPWYILLVGSLVATGTFLVELLLKQEA